MARSAQDLCPLAYGVFNETVYAVSHISALDRSRRSAGRFHLARVRPAWYVALDSRALRRKPQTATILDTPLVLFRTAGGTCAALLDRCPHRNVPLSLGRVQGDRLACRYHGWQFDAQGRCRLVPTLCGPQEARARNAIAFPTREQQGFVWVWMAPDTEPTYEPFAFPLLGAPGYRSFRIDYRVEGSLHAVLENMLDVPHTAFLHRGLFRGGRQHRIRACIRRRAASVEAEYIGEPPPRGLAARILGIGSSSDATVTHFDRFILPSISQVEYRLGASHFLATSALTPESDFVTRFSTVITYRLPIPGLLLRVLFEPIARRILAQDAWIVREQTRTVRHFGEEDYTSTPVDVLGPEIWRLLERAQANGLAAAAAVGAEAAEKERTVELLV